jgi:hypothetical protein
LLLKRTRTISPQGCLHVNIEINQRQWMSWHFLPWAPCRYCAFWKCQTSLLGKEPTWDIFQFGAVRKTRLFCSSESEYLHLSTINHGHFSSHFISPFASTLSFGKMSACASHYSINPTLRDTMTYRVSLRVPFTDCTPGIQYYDGDRDDCLTIGRTRLSFERCKSFTALPSHSSKPKYIYFIHNL